MSHQICLINQVNENYGDLYSMIHEGCGVRSSHELCARLMVYEPHKR